MSIHHSVRVGFLLLLLFLLLQGISNAQEFPTEPVIHEVKGVLHIHSIYSDGSGSVDEIAQYANESKLDFVIITDHDTLQTLVDNREGWNGSTLVLIGDEISTSSGHLLALNIPKDFKVDKSQTTQEVLNLIKANNGIAIPAHPFDVKYPWTNWKVSGFQGMEVINLMELLGAEQDAIRKMAFEMFYTNIDFSAIFRQGLSSYPGGLLYQWDRLNSKNKVALIGGSDIHARVIYDGLVYEVPPYLDALNAMRTHLMLSAPLSKNLDTDKKAIYEALANGNSFIGYDMLGDTTGFRFYAGDGTKTVSMGESIAYKKGIHLAAMAPEAKGIDPEQITIKILRNSLVVAKGDGNGLSYDPDRPGPYRAELWLGIGDNARLWALSNPIYVTRANLSK